MSVDIPVGEFIENCTGDTPVEACRAKDVDLKPGDIVELGAHYDHVDLILLDVMLPGIDGYALCRELRQADRTLPVLMLTARGQID